MLTCNTCTSTSKYVLIPLFILISVGDHGHWFDSGILFNDLSIYLCYSHWVKLIASQLKHVMCQLTISRHVTWSFVLYVSMVYALHFKLTLIILNVDYSFVSMTSFSEKTVTLFCT